MSPVSTRGTAFTVRPDAGLRTRLCAAAAVPALLEHLEGLYAGGPVGGIELHLLKYIQNCIESGRVVACDTQLSYRLNSLEGAQLWETYSE